MVLYLLKLSKQLHQRRLYFSFNILPITSVQSYLRVTAADDFFAFRLEA